MLKTNRDPKYGEILEEIVIDNVVSVALIEHKERTWLDIRKLYVDRKDPSTLNVGKGIRLEIDNGIVEDVLLACEALFALIEWEEEYE